MIFSNSMDLNFLYFLCEINVLGFESISPTKLALIFDIAAVVIIFA
jgi:hypothetical protein